MALPEVRTRLLLGLVGTVDYEIAWSSEVVERLAAELGVSAADADPDRPIDDERDLVANLLGFVARGVGGERFVSSTPVIEAVAARFDTRVTLGGSGVRAAIAIAALGYPSRIHIVAIDDNVRRLLPAAVEYLCSAREDALDPHLIVQYPAGTRVRVGDSTIAAEHANRIIYAHDAPGRDMVLRPDIEDLIAQSDVFLACGFNVVQDRRILADRLDRVTRGIGRMPSDRLLYFEDCGYHVPGFGAVVRDRMAPLCDVYSMNEDEMQGIVGRPVDLFDPDDVADAVVRLADLVPARNLVVHSRLWALVTGDDAGWLVDCLEGGATLASTRFRVGDALTAADVAATVDLPTNPAGALVADALEKALAPRLRAIATRMVRVETPTTIGLGDTFAGGFLLRYAQRRDARLALVPERPPVTVETSSGNSPPHESHPSEGEPPWVPST